MTLNEEQLVTLAKLFAAMDNKDGGVSLPEAKWLDGIGPDIMVAGRWVYKLGGIPITTVCVSGWSRHPHKPETNIGHHYFLILGDAWDIEYHRHPNGELRDDYPTPVIAKGSKKNLERDLLYAKMLFG
jgi:hypothetical protein